MISNHRFGQTYILIALGLLVIVCGWFLLLRTTQEVAVPTDFQVERQVISELSGEKLGKGIRIANGILLYEDGRPARKLSKPELQKLFSKRPWPVNESYMSEGGGDTFLTSLTITSNRNTRRVAFDDAPSTKVNKEVLHFNAYLDELAGFPQSHRQ